jgi:uncharacterized membrane protein YqhA
MNSLIVGLVGIVLAVVIAILLILIWFGKKEIEENKKRENDTKKELKKLINEKFDDLEEKIDRIQFLLIALQNRDIQDFTMIKNHNTEMANGLQELKNGYGNISNILDEIEARNIREIDEENNLNK